MMTILKSIFNTLLEVSSILLFARPDNAYVVMALGQYNASLTRAHLLAAKGVLCYLAGLMDLSLEFGIEQSMISFPIHGFACCHAVMDADWVTDKRDH